MKRFVIGDIHGAHKALVQCLDRSGFNKDEDELIQLGDICDGWGEVYECVEELLKIKNLVAIRGNHDNWFRDWMMLGVHPTSWLQGGDGTLRSYLRNCLGDENAFRSYTGGYLSNLTTIDLPKTHIEFFSNTQKSYHIDNDNNLFVHGGLNRHFFIDDKTYNSDDVLMWDRDLWMAALSYGSMPDGDDVISKNRFRMKNGFKNVFIGHTATINWNTDKPMFAANVINMDTGGGFKGRVTIMNIDSKEYWQSDKVSDLYINEKGRN